MCKIIYNLLIHICLPFFVLFALTRPKMRKNLRERLIPDAVPPHIAGALWIHGASVGEAVIAENLANYMDDREKTQDFLITVNTFYTRDLLRARSHDRRCIRSLPFDLPWSLGRFLGAVSPGALIIVETEIWPNLIWIAKKRNIPVIIINGRISDGTLRQYKRLSFFMKHVFSGVSLVLAQSEEHRERFISIGMDPAKVLTAGNMKYYRELKDGAPGPSREKAITFGSIKEKELEILLPVIRKLRERFREHRIFIAPRELHLVTVLEEQCAESFNVMRYSVFRGLPDARPEIVIVDTIGDLPAIYGRSEIAFVGGSLAPYGGQNMLEPLFFGTPVLFGPYVENFREIAAEIVAQGAGVTVESGDELFQIMSNILGDHMLREKMAREGRAIIAHQKKVMERIAGAVREVV
ncbi:MAG TPA: glycosyltransferase N-terminal domain-containing protein, partial [Syntrophorhabdaceae bacterium]